MTTTDPRGETYEDIQSLIKFLANRFAMKSNGDFDELVSEGNVVFLRVYDSWKPGMGTKFTTYLSTCIWRQYITDYRVRVRKDVVRGCTVDVASVVDRRTIDYTRPGDRLAEFVESLSGDAAMVAKLVIDSPAELAKIVEGKGGHPRNWVSSLREHLKGMGWTLNRIQTTFEEIGHALV